MKRAFVVSLIVVLLAALVCSVSIWAQGVEYSLKDYMPQTVGSKWTMKSTRGAEVTTVTSEVLKAQDVAGQKAMLIVTKGADGAITSGSLESVTPEKLTIFGTMFRRRGAEAGEPTPRLYQPAAVFSGKMRVGQSAEVKVQTSRGDQQRDITMKLELAGVETVKVPKGTFDGCLKLVYTTSFGQFEMKRTVWQAKGVGVVKTERPGRGERPATTTELTDYQLAK